MIPTKMVVVVKDHIDRPIGREPIVNILFLDDDAYKAMVTADSRPRWTMTFRKGTLDLDEASYTLWARVQLSLSTRPSNDDCDAVGYYEP